MALSKTMSIWVPLLLVYNSSLYEGKNNDFSRFSGPFIAILFENKLYNEDLKVDHKCAWGGEGGWIPPTAIFNISEGCNSTFILEGDVGRKLPS